MKYRISLIAASMLFIAGCDQQPGAVYPQRIDEARRALIGTELSPMMFGNLPSLSSGRADGASDVVWIVKAGNTEAFRFIAKLHDAGENATRVQVQIKGVTSGPLGNVEQRMAERSTIRNYYLAAMKEQVAAALERRPYDMVRVYAALGVAIVANMPAIIAQFDRAAEQHERKVRANIERAYRNEAGIRR